MNNNANPNETIARLRGELGVMAGLLERCVDVVLTIEAEGSSESEMLQRLIKDARRAVIYVRSGQLWTTQKPSPDQPVTPFNVGRWCMSEDDCIARGIDFSAYERGVNDAADAFSQNQPTKPQPTTASPLTFEAFRKANRARCIKWHPNGIRSWSPSDWMVAIVGELGELAGLIKMRNRERDGLPGNKFSPTDQQIAFEAADVFTYLDLFCEAHGIDLGLSVAEKFNVVSERVGFPDRIIDGRPARPCDAWSCRGGQVVGAYDHEGLCGKCGGSGWLFKGIAS